MKTPMPRRMKFRDASQLSAAYARLLDQSWVDSCTVDVPALELHLHVANGPRHEQRAEAWIARERRVRRRRTPQRD